MGLEIFGELIMDRLIAEIIKLEQIHGNEVRATINMSPEYFNYLKNIVIIAAIIYLVQIL